MGSISVRHGLGLASAIEGLLSTIEQSLILHLTDGRSALLVRYRTRTLHLFRIGSVWHSRHAFALPCGLGELTLRRIVGTTTR